MKEDPIIAAGYLRKDGSVGIRNKVLIVYTVNCANFVARKIYFHFHRRKEEVDLLGSESCETDSQMTAKLAAFCTHQNVGAVLLVAQGCEGTNMSYLKEQILESRRPVRMVTIRKETGSLAAISKGIEQTRKLMEELQEERCVPLRISQLVVGIECGGSDFTSGLVANPLVGACTDYLVAHNATVLFEEMYEAIGLKSLLLSRCASEQAQKEIEITYDKFYEHAVESGQFSISPGNIRGGLTTIEEKSMGAFIKCGSVPIQGVLKLCQKPRTHGLWYVDMLSDQAEGSGSAVSCDAGSTLLFAASGAHLTLLTSGRGHVINNPIAPVIKITGNARTFQKMPEDFDINAGVLIQKEKEQADLLRELIADIFAVAGGKKSCGEALGHAEYVLNYEKQFSMVEWRGRHGG